MHLCGYTRLVAAMNAENYRYQFVAGNLALDFINTVAYRLDSEKVHDHLQSAAEVRRWSDQVHLPDRNAISSCPSFSKTVLLRVRAVREQLFAIFHAIASDEPIPADALGRVDNALRDSRAKRCLCVQRADVRWIWRPGAGCADFLLYPILISATNLLTSVSRDLVRQCADEGCGWLFLDRSNARKRRWCSMADCGNRSKAREYYRRKVGLV
jgi:predicted RNA-binding Zn ribbon-like protein